MKPCTLTPVRPIRDMNRIRSEFQAWARLGTASLVLALLALSGCDLAAPVAATAPTDSTAVVAPIDTTGPGFHEWYMCQTGEPPEVCPSCAPVLYKWGVDVALSTGDTIRIPDDSTVCKRIGALPDTLRISIDGTSQTGTKLDRWLLVDDNPVQFRFDFPAVPDSLVAYWRLEGTH